MRIIGYTRIRNEALILQETLDHWGQLCDGIYVYDDASTDNTREIAHSHPKVRCVFENDDWQPGVEQNGRQRGAIYDVACYRENPDEQTWFCCFDADERLEGIDRSDIERANKEGRSGILVRLFDHYITAEDAEREYGGDLTRLRQWVGPEYRDQLFFFRHTPYVGYRSSIAREPNGVYISGLVEAGFCRHFGKAISVGHWEETCTYYSTYFPEPFKSKWAARKGKAVHMESDFGRPLLRWDELGKVKLGPRLYMYRG